MAFRFIVEPAQTGPLLPAERIPFCEITVTLKVQLDELPAPSNATVVTVVTPIGNKLPDTGVDSMLTVDEQLSVAPTV